MDDSKRALLEPLITRAAKGILWWYRNENNKRISVDQFKQAADLLGEIHNDLLNLGITYDQIHKINHRIYVVYKNPFFEITERGIKNLMATLFVEKPLN
jgi:hypothetical protein